MLRVGYAQNEITPPLSPTVYLAGFGQNRRATIVHDPLFSRALAIENKGVRIVLISLDLLGLYRPYWQEITRRIQTSHPQVEILGACTHTHHGPDTMGLWGPNRFTSGVNYPYLRTIITTVEKTALAALNNLTLARFRSASISVPGVAKNARDPEIVDDELTCLQFSDHLAETTLATVTIFPCHPEVLWDGNPEITSDYPAYLRHEIENATHAPCLFFSGAIGGMMTPNVQEHSFKEAEIMGKKLAQFAIQAILSQQDLDEPVIQFKRTDFTIPLTNPIFKAARLLGLLPKDIGRKGIITTEISLLMIGKTHILGVPGELLPKLGFEIKTKLKNNGAEVAAIIGLANDELGYILPENEYTFPKNPFNPKEHYEETMSVGPKAGTNLISSVNSLLNQVESDWYNERSQMI
jgi:hypothetical protein